MFIFLSLGLLITTPFTGQVQGARVEDVEADVPPELMGHQSGWLTTAIVIFLTLLMLFRRLVPSLSFELMRAHCFLSLLSIPLSLYHNEGLRSVRNIPITGLLTLVVMLSLQVSGLLLRYLQGIGKSRYYLRSVHLPLCIVFYFSLFFHVVEGLS